MTANIDPPHGGTTATASSGPDPRAGATSAPANPSTPAPTAEVAGAAGRGRLARLWRGRPEDPAWAPAPDRPL